MIDVEYLDELVQYGRGRAAEYIGPPCDVYRLQPGVSSGSVLNDESRIFQNVNARFTRSNSAIIIEQTPVYDMIYTMTADATNIQVGDIFVEKGSRADGGIYAIGQLRSMGANIAIRTEIAGAITRPWGQGDSEQLLGTVDHQGIGKSYERPYRLEKGFYYCDKIDVSPAVIPFGLQPYKRLGPMPEYKYPSTTHRTEMFAFVPLLPGLYIEPGDMLSDQNGQRFQVHSLSSFTTGIQGYFLILESTFV